MLALVILLAACGSAEPHPVPSRAAPEASPALFREGAFETGQFYAATGRAAPYALYERDVWIGVDLERRLVHVIGVRLARSGPGLLSVELGLSRAETAPAQTCTLEAERVPLTITCPGLLGADPVMMTRVSDPAIVARLTALVAELRPPPGVCDRAIRCCTELVPRMQEGATCHPIEEVGDPPSPSLCEAHLAGLAELASRTRVDLPAHCR